MKAKLLLTDGALLQAILNRPADPMDDFCDAQRQFAASVQRGDATEAHLHLSRMQQARLQIKAQTEVAA